MHSTDLDSKPKPNPKRPTPLALASRALGIPQKRILAFKFYGDEVVVVTTDGKKLRGRLPKYE